jgi:YfiH family protein
VLHLDTVELGSGVGAWFTGRDLDLDEPPLGRAGNLAHRRPHRPVDLASARAELGTRTGTDPRVWHLLHQVHGAEVAVVTASTPPGAELRGVDAAVTDEPDRPLVVQVADCVPVLVTAPTAVGVAHAGRRGVELGVVARLVAAVADLGVRTDALSAVIGPAIGGCCYEVPAALRDEVAAVVPDTRAETTWGTPSLDLPAGVEAQLADAEVADVRRVGGCTRCDPDRRWFSHRGDPGAGRQVGLVVRRDT